MSSSPLYLNTRVNSSPTGLAATPSSDKARVSSLGFSPGTVPSDVMTVSKTCGVALKKMHESIVKQRDIQSYEGTRNESPTRKAWLSSAGRISNISRAFEEALGKPKEELDLITEAQAKVKEITSRLKEGWEKEVTEVENKLRQDLVKLTVQLNGERKEGKSN